MIYRSACTVLEKVRDLTHLGSIKWTVDPRDRDCFRSSVVGNRGITIEFLYVEPTTTGADRHLVHFEMEGMNCFAACGTESYGLVIEILAAAFEDWKDHLKRTLDGHGSALALLDSL